MKNKLLTMLIVLMSASFMVACPKGSNDSSDMGASIEDPTEAVSAPASQINAENADAQADAILKDIENL